jgi:hypothetical protein
MAWKSVRHFSHHFAHTHGKRWGGPHPMKPLPKRTSCGDTIEVYASMEAYTFSQATSNPFFGGSYRPRPWQELLG